MSEVVLVRQTGARSILQLEQPFPDTLTRDGVRYVYQRHADPVERRPWYVEAPEAPPLVRLCMHGCPGCGRVEPCGEGPCPVGIGRARRCAACTAERGLGKPGACP